MIFHDYGHSDFGVLGCQQLDPPLANLKTLLDAANTAGLTSNATVVAAQSVYDDANSYVVFLPIGNDCDNVTTGVVSAYNTLSAYLKTATTTPLPPLPYPTYTQPPPGTNNYGLPTWIPFVLVAGVIAYGLSSVARFLPQKSVQGFFGRRRVRRRR